MHYCSTHYNTRYNTQLQHITAAHNCSTSLSTHYNGGRRKEGCINLYIYHLRVLPPETLIERHIGRRRVHLKEEGER